MYKGEINLLPLPLRKKRLVKAYLKSINRLLSRTWMLLLFVVLAEGAIFAVVKSVDNSFSRNNDQALGSGIDVEGEVVTTNRFLGEFSDKLDNSVLWTDLLNDVFKIVPATVTLQSMSADDDQSLVLVGASSRRSDMIDFQKKIEALDWVDRIDAPLSNFTVGSDETFEFTIFLNEDRV